MEKEIFHFEDIREWEFGGLPHASCARELRLDKGAWVEEINFGFFAKEKSENNSDCHHERRDLLVVIIEWQSS